MFRIIASICLLLASPAAVFAQADVILVGANVFTADSSRPAVEAIALAGQRIRAVGSNQNIRRLVGAKTRVVDLRGQTVIPGLMDAHVHLLVGSMIVDEPSLKDYERAVLPKVMAGFLRHG